MFHDLGKSEGNQTFLEVTNLTYGFFHDVIKALGEELNFTFEIFKRTDAQWGTLMNGTKWSGMVGDVLEGSPPFQYLGTSAVVNPISGRADMIGASLTLTAERGAVLKFVLPLASETEAIYIKSTGTQAFDWSLFFTPFRVDFWGALSVFSIICAIFLTIFTLASQRDGDNISFGWFSGAAQYFGRTNVGIWGSYFGGTSIYRLNCN